MGNMLAKNILDILPGITREWRTEMELGLPEGLNPNQFRALYLVQAGHNQCCRLIKHVGVTPAAMSKIVDHLEAQNLLVREPSLEDRRHVTLVLTSKGQRVVERVRGQVEKRLEVYLDNFSQQQKDFIQQGLLLLQEAFTRREDPR